MKLRYTAIIGLGLAVFTVLADPGDPVVLYQPQEVVGERMMDDVKSFAAFIQDAQNAWSTVVTNTSFRSQTAMVVAIGSNRETRGWIVGEFENTNRNNQFTTILRKIKTPAMRSGIVAFAVSGSQFKQESPSPSSFSPPMPQEWREAMKEAKKSEIIDRLLERLLPEETKKAPNQASQVTARKLAEPER